MSTRLNFLCLSEDPRSSQRCAELAKEFGYSFSSLPATERIESLPQSFDQIQWVLLHAPSLKGVPLTGLVQSLKSGFKDSFVCIVGEAGESICGDLLLSEEDFFNTSRLEYVSSQIIRAMFVPVPLADFENGSVLDFTLYHLLPLNQKILPVLPKGTPWSEAKLRKLQRVQEVYIQRSEMDRYRHFIDSVLGDSGPGLPTRVRAQYFSFCNSYSQLVFHLINRNESASLKDRKWLYDRCLNQCRELLRTLSLSSDSPDIVSKATVGEVASLERVTAFAAHAGLLSLEASIGDPLEAMMAALLSDLGLLDLQPQLSRKIRQDPIFKSLSKEELKSYRAHPQLSLSFAEEKGLPLTSVLEDIIRKSHERFDGKGFPGDFFGAQIPEEAMVLQICERLEREIATSSGEEARTVKDAKAKVLSEAISDGAAFSPFFLEKIKPVF